MHVRVSPPWVCLDTDYCRQERGDGNGSKNTGRALHMRMVKPWFDTFACQVLRGWRTERGKLMRWVRVVTDCHSSPTNRCLAWLLLVDYLHFIVVLAASLRVVPHYFSIALRAQDSHLRGILCLLEPSVSPSKRRLGPPPPKERLRFKYLSKPAILRVYETGRHAVSVRHEKRLFF